MMRNYDLVCYYERERERKRMIEWKERDRKIIDIGCLLDETFTVGWRERERETENLAKCQKILAWPSL